MIDLLDNPVMPYAWGSRHLIPDLLGVPADGRPQAELWLGGHPLAPSTVDRGDGPRQLHALIEADPVRELGDRDAARFGARLPFLLKVIAADRPLSLQVHPTAAQAREGFAVEEARGIPRDAPERNYRDPHHKPELVCALTAFDALCGFRPPAVSAALLTELTGRGAGCLAPYAAILAATHAEPGTHDDALRQVVVQMLALPAVAAGKAVAEVSGACAALGSGPFADAAAAVVELAAAYPDDPGVLVALLLNHVLLAPGEALFLEPGTPHAYLRGCGVEVMASSDNVLRCGLTSKHVDVPELLRVLRFEAAPAPVSAPDRTGSGEIVYKAPVPEFELSRIDLDGRKPVRLSGGSAQILLCVAGEAALTGDRPTGGELTTRESTAREVTASQPVPHLTRGRSAYVPAGAGGVTVTGSGTLFRVTTGA